MFAGPFGVPLPVSWYFPGGRPPYPPMIGHVRGALGGPASRFLVFPGGTTPVPPDDRSCARGPWGSRFPFPGISRGDDPPYPPMIGHVRGALGGPASRFLVF